VCGGGGKVMLTPTHSIAKLSGFGHDQCVHVQNVEYISRVWHHVVESM
jgi:hypothetical protein